MRYQIADGLIDYIHICWLAFLLAPLGAFAMGSANGSSVFGGLRDDRSHLWWATLIVVLAVGPILAIGRGYWRAYVALRCGSAGWYGYLYYLCVIARPVSTGVVYVVLSAGAVALAWSAYRAAHRREARPCGIV